ncbi:MAG: LacI family DNA-binding transcriptional regulator [Tissierellaceae bacterium]
MKQKPCSKAKISIHDVAREAGVSVSTVSRVIRKYSNVTPETESVVNEAIKKLKYTPNAAASRLGSGSFDNIGVVFTRSADMAFHNPFFSEALMGIGHVLEAYDYSMQLMMYDDAEREKEKVMVALASGMIKGVISLSTRYYDMLVQELSNSQYPFVILGRVEGNSFKDNIYSVNTNNREDSFKIVDHLAKLGHKRIGILNESKEYLVNMDRYDGYRRALLSNGLIFDPSLEINAGYSLDDSKKSIIERIKRKNDITAIFAKDDLKAIAAIQGIKELGLKVPEDIAVVGYNDYEIAKISSPRLTTIKVPVYELGVESAKMLIKLINDEEIDNNECILETKLVIRESCGFKENNEQK